MNRSRHFSPKETAMKIQSLLAITVALSVSSVAFAAEDGETLFKKSGCSMCHSVAKKIVGPAYRDVAAKYRGNKDAQAMLEKKVRNGGSGNWGKASMPPQKKVSDETIKTIVQWVLSLK
jgi:cytochrome c